MNSDGKGGSNAQEVLVADPCPSNCLVIVEWMEVRDEQVTSKPLRAGDVKEGMWAVTLVVVETQLARLKWLRASTALVVKTGLIVSFLRLLF